MKILKADQYKPGYVRVDVEHRRFFLWREQLTVIVRISEAAGWTHFNVILVLLNGRIVSGRRSLRKRIRDWRGIKYG